MTDPQAPMGPELTAREREVLSMVARGFTNREIGEALFISESTAGVHVSHIMAKLGVGSRTEAAAYAYRAGLIPSASDPAAIPEPPSPAPPSVAPPRPAGWIAGVQAGLRDQLRRHPRRVAAIGLGSVAVLAAITVGLAIVVLGAGRPVAGGVPSPTLTASPSPTVSASTSASPSPSPTSSPTSEPSASASLAPPTAAPSPTPVPTPRSWTAIASLGPTRYHTATLLPGGQVLVAGGASINSSNGGFDAQASATLYDSINGPWNVTGSMAARRFQHTATLLADGQVLVAGGYGRSGEVLTSAERYDPRNGTWTAMGAMHEGRYLHTATLLPNGRVLVAGGFNGTGITAHTLASAEVYDPSTGSWTATESMIDARYGHTATLLPNGRVLVVGGTTEGGELFSAELYDPSSGHWTATGDMDGLRGGHTATLLPDGRVLVAGGSYAGPQASAELYDPSTGQWTAAGNMREARLAHTATLLADGKALIVGGYDEGGATLASAELYDPTSGSWTAAGDMVAPRQYHTATLLPDGRVLVAGGVGSSGPQTPAELYDPSKR